MGSFQGGHVDGVESAVFSPDDSRIASGSWDRTIRLWDVATGEQIGQPFVGHEGYVRSIAFIRATRLVSGSYNKSIRIWNVLTGKQVGEPLVLAHTDWVFSVAFSPNGRQLVSGSSDGTIRVWDLMEVYGGDRIDIQAESF